MRFLTSLLFVKFIFFSKKVFSVFFKTLSFIKPNEIFNFPTLVIKKTLKRAEAHLNVYLFVKKVGREVFYLSRSLLMFGYQLAKN